MVLYFRGGVMRNISFALTTPQFYRRVKTVTRRLGWQCLSPEGGELLCGVENVQGLGPGVAIKRLAVIRTWSACRERLDTVTPGDVSREGFPGMTPRQFVRMFCESHESCKPSSVITRIEYEFVPGGRFLAAGFCRVCGCSEFDACLPNAHGETFGWVNDRGLISRNATTLCSRCFFVDKFGPLHA